MVFSLCTGFFWRFLKFYKTKKIRVYVGSGCPSWSSKVLTWVIPSLSYCKNPTPLRNDFPGLFAFGGRSQGPLFCFPDKGTISCVLPFCFSFAFQKTHEKIFVVRLYQIRLVLLFKDIPHRKNIGVFCMSFLHKQKKTEDTSFPRHLKKNTRTTEVW